MWLLSEESPELADVLTDFLSQVDHAEAARTNLESGEVPLSSTWAAFVDELGLGGLILPDEVGGGGGTLRDAVVAQYICGQSGASVPLLSHLLSSEALRRLPPDPRRDGLMERLIAGDVVTAVLRPSADLAVEEAADGSLSVTGSVGPVLDADLARHLLILLRTDSGGVRVAHLEAGGDGVIITGRSSWSGVRRYGDVVLHGASAHVLGATPVGYADDLLTVARLLLAAERLGGAVACMDRSVEHARTRVQFDRPIGTFQGVKHPLAEVFVQTQMARALLSRAISDLAEDDPGRSVVLDHPMAATGTPLVAAVACDRTFRLAAEQDIEVHGGMGYTWETDSHLSFRRSRADAEFIGGTATDLETLRTQLQEAC